VPAHFYTVTGFTDSTSGTVTTTGGSIDGTAAHPYQATTLRAAINAANGDAGSTITLPAGAYQLTVGNSTTVGELAITASMTIQGSGSATVQQTVAGDRIFDIDPSNTGNVAVTLSGLTLEGGDDSSSGFTGFSTEGAGGGAIRTGGRRTP